MPGRFGRGLLTARGQRKDAICSVAHDASPANVVLVAPTGWELAHGVQSWHGIDPRSREPRRDRALRARIGH